MKRSIFKFYVLVAALTFFTACSNDDDSSIPTGEDEINFKDMESDWVRLTLMNEDRLDIMQADSGEIKYSVASTLVEDERYYMSNSGRYQVAVDRTGGKVRFFDSGIINHDDHGHELASKWVNKEISTVLPTHVASSRGHIVVFNDGDGSISYINEAQLEIPSYQPETFALEGTVAHHGAGFRLDNGLFAATFKNTDEPGGIPQMVKFIDGNGNVIDNNGGVEVVGIHGDAVNGTHGVFGSTDGVILVDNQNNIDLIPNIGALSPETGDWLGTVKGHDKSNLFFGRSGNLGVFMIDPMSKTMRNIYSGSDVANAMFSFDGDFFLVQTTDNQVLVFDGKTGSLITERYIEMANIPEVTSKGKVSEIEMLQNMENPSPVLVSASKFLYVLAPNRVQIKVLEIETLTHVHTIKLESPVNSIMKNGFYIEGDQKLGYTD